MPKDTVPGTEDREEQQEQNGSVEEIFEEEYEEVTETSEDSDEDDDDNESGNLEEDGAGEQEDEADDGEPESNTPEPPVRKWGGRFNSPEEMEAEFLRISSKQQEPEKQPEKKSDVPDLNSSEIQTLSEHDEADGTNFAVEYLKRKMSERNLQSHELQLLRKIDNEKGTDLQGEYYDLRAARKVREETAPFRNKSQQEAQEAFISREKAINESTNKEFGENLKPLEEYCSNVKNVEKILQQSPFAHLIMHEHNHGSPATAHRLLLREAALLRKETSADKKRKSVKADPGSRPSARGSAPKALTIEDAWEQAESEQDE